jgi:hypothetical protein
MVGMARLNRSGALVHVPASNGEFLLDVSWTPSAKCNRDRYTRDGARYEPVLARRVRNSGQTERIGYAADMKEESIP